MDFLLYYSNRMGDVKMFENNGNVFDNSIFNELETEFVKFLGNLENPLKSEFLLPTIVDGMIKDKDEKVKVLTTDDRWYGVTYKEDVEPVKLAIKKLVDDGLYSRM